jgi:hypothetical protein
VKDRSPYARVLLLAGLIAATPFAQAGAATPSTPDSPKELNAQAARQYAEIPLSFEANQGQASASARFLARGNGYGFYLTGDAAVIALCKDTQTATGPKIAFQADTPRRSARCESFRMQLFGASLAAKPTSEEKLPGTVNYFIGNDRAHWQTGIPTYARVRFQNVYPGIDVVYYGNHRQLEYDFVIAPGADPRAIRLQFDSGSKMRQSTTGDLLVSQSSGAITLRKPAIYQLVDGCRVPVAGEFATAGRNAVRFRLGRYDRTKPLVIDPVLEYSTFLSGSGNPNDALLGAWGSAIAIDSQGNAYVTGTTVSTDFPTTQGAFQATDPGANITAFVSKLNAAGTALEYSTYLGGSVYDEASAIAVDADGDAYVTGATASLNFPVTPGVLQSANKKAEGTFNAFVTELNPGGTGLIYSTYLGGSISDVADAIAVDATGNVYVAGNALSTDFPVTQGAFQTTNNGAAALTGNAFVSKINAGGTALIYSTFIGGSGGPRTGLGACISAAGNGGNQDGAFAVTVDAGGDAYIAGTAISSDFPVTQGAFQTKNNGAATQTYNAFVAKLNPAGSALIYSTFLGGSGLPQCGSETALSAAGDSAYALSVDGSGDAYVAGIAFSQNFPVTQGAFQTTNKFSFTIGPYAYPGPTAFVAKLNPSGSALVYSTYLGGSGGFVARTPDFAAYGGDVALGLAVDGNGNAYVTGATASSNFPVTAGAYQTTNASATNSGAYYNAFVTVLNPAGNALIYSTYLGGNGSNPNVESNEQVVEYGDESNAMALDLSGNVYLTGVAESADFPVTSGAYLTTIPSFTSAFVTKLNLASVVSPPGFSISSTPVTVTPGATTGNTSTITVTPTGGFTGNVTLTAALTSAPSGAVNLPTFSFGSTSPVNIAGAGAGTATLTISTNPSGICGSEPGNGNAEKTLWPISGSTALAVLVLFSVPRRRRWSAWLKLVLLAGLVAGISACTPKVSKTTCNAAAVQTTPGTYTITVTGTSGATTATGTVALTVQ